MYVGSGEVVVDVEVVLDDVVTVAELEAVLDGAIGVFVSDGATTVSLFEALESSTPPSTALTIIMRSEERRVGKECPV